MGSSARRLSWARRSTAASGAAARRAAQAEAERWEAFRRYLTDFPRLDIAPPATLELWERFLVYGIAFGIAERVLQGAQLHMPEALAQASTLYWIGPHGDLASGPTSMSVGDLAVRVRLGARTALVRVGRVRRRLLGRWRRRRWRWRRRRLVKAVRAAALALAIAGAAGCGGGEQSSSSRTTTASTTPIEQPCSPGVHAFKLGTASRSGCGSPPRVTVTER